MVLAAVGGYHAYIHFLAPAGTPQEPALQTVAEAIDINGSALAPTAVLTDTPTATPTPTPNATATPTPTTTPTLTPTPTPTHPLMIEVMRQQAYPGSEITIEETLDPGSNYDRYIASYLSEGLKIYALLTVPRGEKPESGWPVVIFNHGYIPPDQYRTTERYVAYVDAFARSGYIVFRSDYRGHGNSEGEVTSGYGSPAYTIDVLNAVSSIRNYPDADPDRIGMWGHSLGGHITLKSMVVTEDIKAGVIWAGVVASYPDLFEQWRRRYGGNPTPTPNPLSSRRRWRQELFEVYGSPEENPGFWASISPNSYLSDLSGPIQLHHGTADSSVPVEFSETLSSQIQEAGKSVELHTYENDNHNISNHFGIAVERSVQFFDTHVKGY
jgi:dipeptidyl aminopeptidase/acylaminoacyl peptidase